MSSHDYKVREVASGLGFVEAPLALDDGRVLVADIKSSAILAIDPGCTPFFRRYAA